MEPDTALTPRGLCANPASASGEWIKCMRQLPFYHVKRHEYSWDLVDDSEYTAGYGWKIFGVLIINKKVCSWHIFVFRYFMSFCLRVKDDFLISFHYLEFGLLINDGEDHTDGWYKGR